MPSNEDGCSNAGHLTSLAELDNHQIAKCQQPDSLGTNRNIVDSSYGMQSSATRVFSSLLPEYNMPKSACEATSDGEFINILPDKAFVEGQNYIATPQQEANLQRFSFFSSALESTIYAAELSGLNLPGGSVQDLFSSLDEENNGVWWLNMNNPTGEEVQTISNAFGIHPLTTEDIITQETREKIELFPSYYFSCFRSFRSVEQPTGTDYIPFNMYVVAFREGTLSFSFAPDAHASRVRTRISNLKEYVSLSSDWICYALINDIVDSFAPVVSRLECEAEELEEQRFIARPDDNWKFLQRISIARKNTTSLMRLLGGKADVLRGFTKRCTENYKVTPHMDIALYLGDIQDHVVTMTNSLVHVEQMLSRSHSNYLTQLSINRIAQGNRVNQFLTRVTVLATVLVPLVVVTVLFGMNVSVPWKHESKLNAWFGIVGSIIVFALVCILVARKRSWKLAVSPLGVCHIGGKTSEIPSTDTAFYWRDGHYVASMKVQWTDPTKSESILDFIGKCQDQLLPFSIERKAAYVNYIDGAVSNWEQAYYGENYARLQKVKTEWDSDNFFSNDQSIKPIEKMAARKTVVGVRKMVRDTRMGQQTAAVSVAV